jgi:hypothetical protein
MSRKPSRLSGHYETDLLFEEVFNEKAERQPMLESAVVLEYENVKNIVSNGELFVNKVGTAVYVCTVINGEVYRVQLNKTN